MTDHKFKIGDKIVRFGRVYEIFKISIEENPDTGEDEELIYFKPVYESQANKTLICAIPVSNIDLTNIRLPMSEEECDNLLDLLDSKYEMKGRFNTRLAKEVLKTNEPEKIAMMLKKLAIVKRDPDVNFTYTKKTVFRQGLKRLQEEVALVKGISLEEARKKLIKMLQSQAAQSLPLDEDGDLD
ncbi:MAG: Transcriptional regulator [Microgenomates bacterium 39_7]|nr:MAG: Transcriptional regulator [Microgenomates bacterium 39_7]